MRPFLLFIALAFMFTACGGGEGFEGPSEPREAQPMEPEVVEPEEPEVEEPESEGYCYSTDQETLIEFLSEITSRNGFVARWKRGPVLRVAQGATTQEEEIVEESVKRLNGILPEQYQIEIGASVTPFVEKVPEGSIYVDFAPVEDWVGACSGKEDVLGCADIPTIGTELRLSHVWIVRLETIGELPQCENRHVALVSHELLHTLGFIGGPNDDHPSSKWGADTIMNNIGYFCDTPTSRRLHLFAMQGMGNQEEFKISEAPGQLDRDALRALYTLDDGDYPEELRIDPEQQCVE